MGFNSGFKGLMIPAMYILLSYSTLVTHTHTHHKNVVIIKHFNFLMGRLAQSVQRVATGWTVRGSNPGGGEIFRTCPDRPWGPPSLLYNGYRVFPGGKERWKRDADPSPPSSAVGRTVCTQPQCLYKGALYPLFLTSQLTHE